MSEAHDCTACPAHHVGNLIRLGVNMTNWDYVVALTGNPNTGKSTVFNSLTGLRQHTGNWPGKTVMRAEGGFSYGGKRYKLVDLPGTYSLIPTTLDEAITRDVLLGRLADAPAPELVVCVVDAVHLPIGLRLALEVKRLGLPMVLALTAKPIAAGVTP